MRLTKLATAALVSIVLLSSISCATKTYQLSITVNGEGSVMPSSGKHLANAKEILLAVPAPGWTFDHWEGALTGNKSPASVIMSSDKTVAAYFVASSNESANATALEFTTYTNSSMGFSISVPASWMTMAMGGIAVFASNSSTCTGTSVNIIETKTLGLNLQSTHEAALMAVHGLNGTLTSDQEPTVDGVTAVEVTYTINSGQTGFETTQYYLSKGGMDWIITCMSDANCYYMDVGTFNTMISSFHVLK